MGLTSVLVNDVPESAADAFEVVTVNASLRTKVTSSLSSLSSLMARIVRGPWLRLPVLRQHQIRDRHTGALLRSIPDATDGRDVASELRNDLATLTRRDFASRYGLS